MKKNDILATYYDSELFGALQVYLFTLNAPDAYQAAGRQVPQQSGINQTNLQRAKVSLMNLGMNESQIREIGRVIEFSARNRFLVFTLTLVACVAGPWPVVNVPQDAIPDLSDTQVIVYSK